MLATTYTYDTNDNRLTRNSENASYDAQDRVQTYAGDSFTWSPNGTLATHVAAGQTTTYAWDLRGSLASAALPDGRTVDYVLDAMGRRIGKKINGVLQCGWLYDSRDRPVAQLSSNSVVTNCFVYTDLSATPSFSLAGTIYYALISDERGSVRFVINTANGTVAEALDYDEFGNVISDSNPGFQPFGFAGGLYDPDTALVRFGAREYLAETGQWLARDPIGFDGGLFSLYCYAGNDPVNSIDLSGTGPYDAVNITSNVPVAQLGVVKSFDSRPAKLLIHRGSYLITAKEGDQIYAGDKIISSHTGSVIEFYLGGGAAIQPDSVEFVIDSHHAVSSMLSNFWQIWSNVSHQKETIQIQTNAGVMGIKG